MPNTSRSERRLGTAFLIPLLTLGLIACEPQGQQAAGDGGMDTTGMVPPAAETQPPTTGAVPPGGAAPALAPAQVGGILSAADSSEIKPSQLAQERAQNEEVRAFAQRMIQDHGMLEDSLRMMMQRENITPQPSNISQQLESQTQSTMQQLQNLSGAEFDRAYMQAMVQSHQQALNLVDQQLIPGTQDQQMRQALEQQVRPIIASHLELAQRLQQTLNAGAGGTGAS